MWHFRFIGKLLSALALLGFVECQTALAAYPISSEFSMNQPQEAQGPTGSFQLAVMGGGAIPLDIPQEKFPQKAQPEKPAVNKTKAIPKASKPKKKKVKKAKVNKAKITKDKVKKAPAKKAVVAKEEDGFLTKTFKTLVGDDDNKKSPAANTLVQKKPGEKSETKEDGFLSKTLNTLVGGDDDKKKASSKPKPQKTAEKKPEPEKKDEGLFTKTLKTLVGGEKKDKKDKKVEKTAKKNALDPISMVPTGSASHKKKVEENPNTAISETKKTLKDSFEKLIGVGSTEKPVEETKPAPTEQAEIKKVSVEEKVVKKAAPPKSKRITARKYVEDEEAQLEKDRGGTEKGKNVLKDSFKKLVTEEKKKALVE
jgi:hypothetical protein